MKPGPAGLFAWAARGECAAWLVALAAAAILLALAQYESRDPDSALYAAISADLAGRPAAQWIAPEWNGYWSLHGLYREHPAGVFVPPAVVARLGYPPRQAAYLVNAIYQVLTLLLMLALAREFLPRHDSRLIVTLLLLLPIAFAYRIRANQEQPLLMFLLAALYGIERSRASLRWAVLATAGLAGLFLVKGVFVVVAVVAAAVWLVVRQWGWPDRPIRLKPWLSLAIGVACLSAFYIAYDAAYTRVTGEQFFWWYFSRQFGVAKAFSAAHPVAGALYSLAWYGGRIAWFAAPWTIIGVIGLWRSVGRLRRGHGERAPARARDARLRGAVFCAAVAGVYLTAFVVFQRRADRYIFPVYYVLAAWCAGYGLRLYPSVRRIAWKATRALYPYEQAAVWLASVLLALIWASLDLSSLRIWR
jgi:4-amino-4-deoxy-L-arabinose transferase-like glycosyltransferase